MVLDNSLDLSRTITFAIHSNISDSSLATDEKNTENILQDHIHFHDFGTNIVNDNPEM